MSYLCNRVCENKTEYGYCKTAYCIYPEFPHRGVSYTYRAVGYTSAKPKTNADRIRSMTDEELAKYLAWLVDKQTCSPEWLIWLKDEVKDV